MIKVIPQLDPRTHVASSEDEGPTCSSVPVIKKEDEGGWTELPEGFSQRQIRFPI